MAMNAPQSTRSSSSASSIMHSPLVLLVGGILLLATFIYCSFIQIQTSEAYLLGRQPLDVGFTWSVPQQLWDLVTAKLTGIEGIVDAACWAVEVFTIIVGVGLDRAIAGVRKSSELLSNLFLWLSFLLLLWNGFTDYQYAGLPTGFFGQSFVALAVSMGVVYGLPAGIELVSIAIRLLRR